MTPLTKKLNIGAWFVIVHRDAQHVGYTSGNLPAFVAKSPAAGKWLRREGYVYSSHHEMKTLFEPLRTGRCWV